MLHTLVSPYPQPHSGLRPPTNSRAGGKRSDVSAGFCLTHLVDDERPPAKKIRLFTHRNTAHFTSETRECESSVPDSHVCSETQDVFPE